MKGEASFLTGVQDTIKKKSLEQATLEKEQTPGANKKTKNRGVHHHKEEDGW